MGMICLAGGVCLCVGFRGMLDLLAAQWASGLASLLLSVAAAVASLGLCRHRDDLLV
ncbi:hypothetical protein [Fontivita pretiosa]|uniref:hypothetical protein n=1 Tax=Fontivita pretiosa TaxID=2989684 RepID=UPI003D174EB7